MRFRAVVVAIEFHMQAWGSTSLYMHEITLYPGGNIENHVQSLILTYAHTELQFQR